MFDELVNEFLTAEVVLGIDLTERPEPLVRIANLTRRQLEDLRGRLNESTLPDGATLTLDEAVDRVLADFTTTARASRTPRSRTASTSE